MVRVIEETWNLSHFVPIFLTGEAMPTVFRIFCLLLFLPLWGCDKTSSPDPRDSAPWFIDRTQASGVDFLHDNGMSGERYFCEIVGPGVAVLDIDSDGDMDLAINQGHLLVKDSTSPPVRSLPYPDQRPSGLRIFRNEGVQNGVPVFSDMTEETGIESSVYGMGLAVSDFNRDGKPDLLVTGFGVDEFWVSGPDGKYQDQAGSLGLADDRWTTSAAFVDIDRDGDEDLYVCSYVDFRLENHKPCFGSTSLIDYCGPSSYPSLTDRFYLNDGAGSFADWTEESGIGAHQGAGLGVASSDLDGNGLLDFYVANDGEVNRLWLQVEPLSFRDSALLNGCALNREGQAEASMGAEIADYDGDGDDDVFLTHLDGETNTLYRNLGQGVFDDVSTESGLGIPSRRWTGFGTVWGDFDNDGWPDLYVTNGAVKMPVEKIAAGELHPLGQPDQLYRNLSGQTFEVFSALAEPAFTKETVGRGAAWADLDNDGDRDLVVTSNGEPARLLINTRGQTNSWIGIIPMDSAGRPLAGVKVEVASNESPETRSGWSRRSGSYLSCHDPRVLIGLGDSNSRVDITVTWPDFSQVKLQGLEVRRYHEVRKQGD